MITLIDYGVGNMNAFVNIYNRLGIQCMIAKKPDDLNNVKKIILPGVGSFDYAMKTLKKSGLREKLDHLVLIEKTPILGICVGMQMMANYSEEGSEEGLGWIDASVLKFDSLSIPYKTKFPHMGWNDVLFTKQSNLLLDLDINSIFYFLHSYYFKCNNNDHIIATSQYGINFVSAVNYENVYGIQFHPEKSHSVGEILLKNFYNL